MDAQHCSLKLQFNQGLWAASALLPMGSSRYCQDSCSQLRNYQLEGMHVLTQLRRFVALGCDHMVARCTYLYFLLYGAIPA